jgi:membrane-bound lytic murein transglycosylase D
MTYRWHRVERGDTLAKIAKQYRTQENAILSFNHLPPNGLHAYEALIIPLPVNESIEVPIAEPRKDWVGPPPFSPGGERVRVHRVQSGDSLWRIARRYGTTPEQLRISNGLMRDSRLRIGQVLRIAERR